jgi:triosephosphate isomerase
MAKKRLIIGNWKMYIEKPEDARAYALGLRRKLRGISGADVWLAVPYPLIAEVARVLESSPVRVGAQALSAYTDGKHTGEVSGVMLKGAGALFSLIGHSERRAAGDSEALVRAQLENAIAQGLAPVLCVGETDRLHEGPAYDGAGDHFSVIEGQLSSALKSVPKNLLKKLAVAYEPVWAIGKSAEHAMKPADLQETTIFIRKVLAELLDRQLALKVPVLYGAAVEPQNAHDLIRDGGVNGLLVGHASARLDDFLAIIHACR